MPVASKVLLNHAHVYESSQGESHVPFPFTWSTKCLEAPDMLLKSRHGCAVDDTKRAAKLVPLIKISHYKVIARDSNPHGVAQLIENEQRTIASRERKPTKSTWSL